MQKTVLVLILFTLLSYLQTPQYQLVGIPSEPTQGGGISQYEPLLPTLPAESSVSLVGLPRVSEEATSSVTTLSSVPEETLTSVTISSTAAASPGEKLSYF